MNKVLESRNILLLKTNVCVCVCMHNVSRYTFKLFNFPREVAVFSELPHNTGINLHANNLLIEGNILILKIIHILGVS